VAEAVPQVMKAKRWEQLWWQREFASPVS